MKETHTQPQPELDQALLRQLVRQLKIINFWISLYGGLLLLVLGIILYMIFQVVTFVRDTNQRIDEVRSNVSDSVNIQKQACESTGGFGDFLRANTDVCN